MTEFFFDVDASVARTCGWRDGDVVPVTVWGTPSPGSIVPVMTRFVRLRLVEADPPWREVPGPACEAEA